MISILLLAATLSAGGPADFKAAFPGASVIESPAGGRLTNASGFEGGGLGDTPEAAARAFLSRYGPAFGLSSRQELVARATVARGQSGPVRFERQIDGLPVFGGDIVVGVNASNAIILVNSSDVPSQVQGSFRVDKKAAIRAAKSGFTGLQMSDAPRAERGWRAVGSALRAVWRVDFTASRPPGDWRIFVDADSRRVLQRVDLRTNKKP